MRSEKDEKRLFIQACQKAGLKVHNVSGEHPASGLVIRDAQGRRFIVNEELEVVKIDVDSARIGVYRRATPGGERTQARFAQRTQRMHSSYAQSRARKVRGKVKAKRSG